MNYEEVPVYTFLRYTLCGCGGRLNEVAGAPMKTSCPPWWLHQCAACSEQQWLQQKSPTLTTRAQS